MDNEIIKKWYGSIIILPLAVYYTVKMGEFTFIDYINLLIHEGGHGIFRFFGDFIYTLGGTLMQIIIPSLCIWFAISNNKKFLLQLFILWLGQNFINIFVYVSDAQEQILPLLGGNKVYHDWHWLLTKLNMLEYDNFIGWIFYSLGIISFIISIITPLFIKEYDYKNVI